MSNGATNDRVTPQNVNGKVKRLLASNGYAVVSRYSPSRVKRNAIEDKNGVSVKDSIIEGWLNIQVWTPARRDSVLKMIAEYLGTEWRVSASGNDGVSVLPPQKQIP